MMNTAATIRTTIAGKAIAAVNPNSALPIIPRTDLTNEIPCLCD